MRKINTLFALLALLLVAGCGRDTCRRVDLEDWQVEYRGEWLPATVPGCIHTDLMACGIIPDPFYGTNEDSVQWVGQRPWKYRTVVTRDMWDGFEHCDLVLQGITLCNVWLEGTAKGVPFRQRLLYCENMFREYRIGLFDFLSNSSLSTQWADLSDSLILKVTFYPIEMNNDNHFAQEVDEDGYPWPDMAYDLPDHRAMSRMAPYMLGWDWGPKLSTVGILGAARLECYDGTLEEPKPVAPASWNVELRQEQDAVGQSFTFYRDGRPLFVKGANWIPCHSFPILTPALKERYRYLLISAKEANMDMLRVWGGGIYEPDFFYDLCDSLGIMVWQDFNFSCALYPSDTAFLDNVRIEAEQQVRRIARHPCVVLWCGNNEVKNGWEDWGWQQQFGWTPAQLEELQHGIDTLFGPDGILAQAVRRYDPLCRAYISSSPLYGWGHPECVTHGDSHYWGVWWGEEPFEQYRDKTGRFMSEYGFQSYPDYSSVCRFCPEGQRTIGSPSMQGHQKHPRGVQIIDKAMLRYYGFDSRSLSLEDYCYVSQLLQAWGMGYGILQHLLAQPRCGGTLFWQFDDCWPVASWSCIDFYGNRKALYYRVCDLFGPQADLGYWQQYYQTYPKDLHLAPPRYTVSQELSRSGQGLTVTLHAENALRDVMLQTKPHVDGYFSCNYFDLAPDSTATLTFLPRDRSQSLEGVTVTVRTLNELYTR